MLTAFVKKQVEIYLLTRIHACQRFLLVLLFSLLTFSATAKPVTIQFWNSMGGNLATVLQKIITTFNQKHPEYHIVSVYKGDYNTSLTALVAAYRAGKPPALVQVYEIGTALMMAERQAIVPVQPLMQQFGYHVTPDIFLPAIGYYYASREGELMSLPFNSSSPVMYVNESLFEKAHLTLKDVPKTWPALALIAKRLQAAGVRCAYTTAWPAWIQLEEFSAWHNIPYATAENGFKSFDVNVLFDNPAVLRQVIFLKTLQIAHQFVYGGRADSAESLFTSGQCALFTESSGARGELKQHVNFSMHVAPLPYWPDIRGAPQNTMIGGASLWVMRGQSTPVYHGIAAFFDFLLQPKTQLYWQRASGYLPLTKAGFSYAEQKGLYRKMPGALVAIESINHKPPTIYSRGIRLGNFPQIRMANNNALEAVFSDQASPQEALHRAAIQANGLLKRFSEMAS